MRSGSPPPNILKLMIIMLIMFYGYMSPYGNKVLRIVALKILELGKYWEDNGDKTRSPPLDSRGRVIRIKKALSPRTKARLSHSLFFTLQKQLS